MLAETEDKKLEDKKSVIKPMRVLEKLCDDIMSHEIK